MNKHPSNRAERLKIKIQKDRFERKAKAERLSLVQRRAEQEELEQREIFNELRQQVSPKDQDADY